MLIKTCKIIYIKRIRSMIISDYWKQDLRIWLAVDALGWNALELMYRLAALADSYSRVGSVSVQVD